MRGVKRGARTRIPQNFRVRSIRESVMLRSYEQIYPLLRIFIAPHNS